ncbi:hypothetical protein PICMEDRAFT_70096 [Pichia membranifaciens NRRL Y-2026]|uniref:Vps41 beta-propeller domain-containing protein n=1 Tax=Pichia membranifaciens NRRL Y-2026 TaxID=763406 RepID=A0A1E3NQX9_9ASCO|nr:hypothetical protein PICMEDRAFT_70096 [Pichia membranifaciens NRRL Y-2026]ODQ48462.1 hypothetical protein PICMEDRAFT_70096 [Pichia membranifaciens NRRL Y-2026]
MPEKQSSADNGSVRGHDYNDEVADSTMEFIEEIQDKANNESGAQPKSHLEADVMANLNEKTVEADVGDTDDEDTMKTEDTEEAEDENEEPPILKYKRLTQLPPRFFHKDPVSTCFIHQKLFIFATHSGIVLICKPDFTPIKIFKAHTASILSADYDGEYFATCSMDGTVIVGLVHDEQASGLVINDSEMVKYNFKRPIHAVALSKPYSKTKSFFCGGTSGDLLHCTKNWLGQRVDTVIDKDGECVTMIKSENDLLVWCNSKGITVGQMSTRNELLHIKVPIGMSRPELYWPKIQFVDTDRILIGWVDHAWYLKIFNESTKKNDRGEEVNNGFHSSGQSTSNVLSTAASSFKLHYDEKRVEIIYHEKLSDCLIAGISEFNNDLMVLNYLPKIGKNQYFPPELKILDGVTFDELSVDELVLKRYQGLGMNDYQLQQYSVEGTEDSKTEMKWFLVCANDAIIIEEFSLHDKLTWYLSKKRYFDAWVLSGLWLDRLEKLKIGKKQLEVYFKEKKWDSASEFTQKVLNIDGGEEFENDQEKMSYIDTVVEEWNNILQVFKEEGILSKYPDMLPVHKFESEKQISEEYYEVLLHSFLKNKEYEKLIHYLEQWDHRLFDLQDIQLHINEVLLDHGDKDDDEIRGLRKIYIANSLELDEPELCVKQLIILKDTTLMEFLDEYHLIGKYIEMLPQIILIGVDETLLTSNELDKLTQETPLFTNVQILVENSHEIVPRDIIGVFEKKDLEIVNYIYLKELGKMDKLLIKDFEDEMIRMYAKFNKGELKGFLKDHKKYSIDDAIKVCEEYECNEELVYLLSKIGENRKALTLIIDKMEDPSKAITFVQSVNEKELWDYLLDYSMSRSKFVKELLLSVGMLVDPIPVVSRIPLGVEIPDLQKAIVNITKNVSLDREIYEIILGIISGEYMEKSLHLRGIRTRGSMMSEVEVAMMRKDIDSCYVKISKEVGGLVKEEDVIGERWRGDRGNKVAHKSYLKFKIGGL